MPNSAPPFPSEADGYQALAIHELLQWQQKMLRKPTVVNALSALAQEKMNALLPEKIHEGITLAIKQMVQGVLFGAKHTTAKPSFFETLAEREEEVRLRIKFYKSAAALEGGITGAGGILLGLADFPILIGLKFKLLFDIAAVYGFDTSLYKERLYILHIFELAFSSHAHRKEVYLKMENWDEKSREWPDDLNQFDWRSFQQQYRDYIDVAKIAQLLPIIGAPVGAVANYHLLKKLGHTAINAYRMRHFANNLPA